MQLKWTIHDPPRATVEKLMRGLKCNRIIATILANRGLKTPQQARAFVYPSLQDLRPPEGLKDMDAAVQRLYRAIQQVEKILIFGDYDVDGVTATAILYEFLAHTGADVSCYIPHRVKEGYGLQPFHVTDTALPQGVNLIVTTDCGSSSHEAVAAANQAGIDVIITDHHELSGPLPQALAILNPKRPDCRAGFDFLSGVGVTFYLLMALRRFLREQRFWVSKAEPNLKVMCDLVALGTVADMVPLNAENRIMTRHGLDILKTGYRPGLEALMQVSGIQKETLDTDDLAFRLAPRINAAGRMDHADQALALLTADSLAAAEPLAQKLQRLNAARQKNEKSLLDQIRSCLDSNPQLLTHRALVLGQTGWHPGILGIVASRLVRMYHRPTVLIAIDGETGSGSARSLAGLNLHAALTSCSRHLIGFGGHALAAGLRIQTGQIDAFRRAFESTVTAMSTEADLTPTFMIDCELAFEEIDPDLIDAITHLQPFGVDSPKPLFMSRDVHVASSQIVANQHRRMVLRQNAAAGHHFHAIQFNIDPSEPRPEHFARIAFELQWNYWNGNRTAQLVIAAGQPEM